MNFVAGVTPKKRKSRLILATVIMKRRRRRKTQIKTKRTSRTEVSSFYLLLNTVHINTQTLYG